MNSVFIAHRVLHINEHTLRNRTARLNTERAIDLLRPPDTIGDNLLWIISVYYNKTGYQKYVNLDYDRQELSMNCKKTKQNTKNSYFSVQGIYFSQGDI